MNSATIVHSKLNEVAVNQVEINDSVVQVNIRTFAVYKKPKGYTNNTG